MNDIDWLNTILIIILIVSAVIALIVLISKIWKWKISIRLREFKKVTTVLRPPTKVDEFTIILEPPSKEYSRKQANERKKLIQDTFRYAEIPFQPEGKEINRFLKNEFIESPPSLRKKDSNIGIESLENRLGQMIRLYRQLTSEKLLLAERVVDAIISILEYNSLSAEYFPLIKIKRLERSFLYVDDFFPWIVILETKHKNFFQDELVKIGDWLGIAIGLSKENRFEQYGKCRVGNGSIGVVGGILRNEDTSFGMTCSHILSKECLSVVVKGNPQMQHQPDAALLFNNTPCFHLPNPTSYCQPVTLQDIDNLMLAKSLLYRVNDRLKNNYAFIDGQINAFALNGFIQRFPHLLLKPHISGLNALLPVSMNRRFCNHGDSGDWVLEKNSNKWIGMLVGGDYSFSIVYIIEAQPLIDFFKSLKIFNHKSNFLPETNLK